MKNFPRENENHFLMLFFSVLKIKYIFIEVSYNNKLCVLCVKKIVSIFPKITRMAKERKTTWKFIILLWWKWGAEKTQENLHRFFMTLWFLYLHKTFFNDIQFIIKNICYLFEFFLLSIGSPKYFQLH